MSDPLPDAAEAVRLRQNLALVALGRRPADRAIAVGRLFAAYAGVWLEDQEVVVAGCRVADVGPTGSWRGEAAEQVDRRRLLAMPGFGEVRKPI